MPDRFTEMCFAEELANMSAAMCHLLGTGAISTDVFDNDSEVPLIEQIYFDLRRMNMDVLRDKYGNIDAIMMVGEYQTVMDSFVSIPELVFPKAISAGHKWRNIILSNSGTAMLEDLSERDREIFRLVLDMLLVL